MKFMLIILIPILLSLQASAEETMHLIETKIILAGKITQSTDPRLTEIAEKFSEYFNYTSYRLVSSEEMELPTKKKHKVSLPEKGYLQLKILRQVDTGISLKIYNRGGKDFNSIVHLKPKGTIHFIASKVKEGDIIVSITLKQFDVQKKELPENNPS